MKFNNKVVLVTGAARGIGRTIAQQFAEQGAQVALHYNSNQSGGTIKKCVNEEGGVAFRLEA